MPLQSLTSLMWLRQDVGSTLALSHSVQRRQLTECYRSHIWMPLTLSTYLQASLSIPVTMRTVMNRMRGENKGSRDDGSAVGVGGHSNGFTGSGDVDSGQDTKVHYTYLAHITLDNKVDLVQVYFSILNTDGWAG